MRQSTPTPSGVAVASDENTTPWMGILGWCLAITVPAVLVAAVIMLLVLGTPAFISTLLAAGVVVLFFAISLLVGHFVGHLAPKALLAAFMTTYIVKVAAFGAFLLVPKSPEWFDRTGATVGAVVAVLVWQGVEMYRFSRMRFRVFADPEPSAVQEKETA